MTKIKFGTDGWRAIIADEFTVANLMRVVQGTGEWMKQKSFSKALIGYDTRFRSRYFAEMSARVLAEMGHQVTVSNNFVSSPMVSYGVVKNKFDIGIVITASHNAAHYNGYKLKSSIGGPLLSSDIKDVELLIPDTCEINPQKFSHYESKEIISSIDLEEQYYQYIMESFDFEAIRKAEFRIVYDGMYGTGQNIFQKIFVDSLRMHSNYNPSFMDIVPDPIKKNVILMSQITAGTPYSCCGIATDGDADRIGMVDENGQFIDAHRIMLLILYYLVKYKGLNGKVVASFSMSNKIQQLAQHFGLEFETTKIGFKAIGAIMANEDVLVGGEESGGIGIKGHIPDKDGIWSGLNIIELMAKSGKKLSELLSDIYEIVGPFEFERDDLKLDQEIVQRIITKAETNNIIEIDGRPIIKREIIDGYKYFLSEDEWVLIRQSGTEQVLRIYAQSQNQRMVRNLLDKAKEMLLN